MITSIRSPLGRVARYWCRTGNFSKRHAHFNRERIPARVVHANGSGAYGTLTITTDITRYAKAKLGSSVGKTTEGFVRFSTVMNPTGSAETGTRDPRGFATKFYTQQGNYDIVGINQPVFFIRDAMKFQERLEVLVDHLEGAKHHQRSATNAIRRARFMALVPYVGTGAL